jgi:hypothetical protein
MDHRAASPQAVGNWTNRPLSAAAGISAQKGRSLGGYWASGFAKTTRKPMAPFASP